MLGFSKAACAEPSRGRVAGGTRGWCQPCPTRGWEPPCHPLVTPLSPPCPRRGRSWLRSWEHPGVRGGEGRGGSGPVVGSCPAVAPQQHRRPPFPLFSDLQHCSVRLCPPKAGGSGVEAAPDGPRCAGDSGGTGCLRSLGLAEPPRSFPSAPQVGAGVRLARFGGRALNSSAFATGFWLGSLGISVGKGFAEAVWVNIAGILAGSGGETTRGLIGPGTEARG